MQATQKYRAEVAIVIPITVDGATDQDAEEQARRIVSTRPWISVRHIASVTLVPMSTSETLDRANRVLWQEMEVLHHGTTSQRQRWHSDCLPEQELLALAREHLLRPLAMFRKRQRMRASAIAHPVDRSGVWTCLERSTGHVPIEWSTLETCPTFTSSEWETVLRLRAVVAELRRHPWLFGEECVQAMPREHRGTCRVCLNEAAERAVLVQIQWAGRVLSREYAL